MGSDMTLICFFPRGDLPVVVVEQGERVLLAGRHADDARARPLHAVLPEKEGGRLVPGPRQVGTQLQVPAKLVQLLQSVNENMISIDLLD